MAEHGIASRRKSEEYIRNGLVKVNGNIVQKMGCIVDSDQDVIEFQGDAIQKDQEQYVYYAINKPIGCVSSAQKTTLEPYVVTDLVPEKPRVFPIGRLDKDSSGLLILSNDGRLTYTLTHPSQVHEKEYEVEVDGVLTNGILTKLRSGLCILGQKTQAPVVERISSSSFNIILTEGKNRHIRRICRKVGLEVIKLKRIRIGSFLLSAIQGDLYKVLTKKEVYLLQNS
jgi:23S rRNA pseudouridine2605 synthase